MITLLKITKEWLVPENALDEFLQSHFMKCNRVISQTKTDTATGPGYIITTERRYE